MRKCVVTGCAGFIGSHLVDRLLSNGDTVIGIDNFSTGRMEFISEAKQSLNFTLHQIDLLEYDQIESVFIGADIVFHLSANADVRNGINHTRVDLEQNTIVTHNVLEAMRVNNVMNIAFSSTGSVYGEAKTIPTPEDAAFPIQTSLYGASKLACEGLISAYAEAFGINAWIFRFVSILGERYTHGHIYDFYKKLKKTPFSLEVLGNGKQRKSYLYIHDCIDAIFLAINNQKENVNILNLGFDDYCDVNSSIGWICKELNLDPKLKYTGGNRGWIGDNPFIYLDTKRMQGIGWNPKVTIQQAIIKTVNYLQENEWVFDDKHAI
mgnify:CR=1 FL=1|tara:strand:+ start:170 stop:1135 length:966 start_codon:yes stop_codon:yes gene_type:complete